MPHKHCAVALAVLGGWQLPKYVGARAQYLGAIQRGLFLKCSTPFEKAKNKVNIDLQISSRLNICKKAMITTHIELNCCPA
jgi:hypothetical protein